MWSMRHTAASLMACMLVTSLTTAKSKGLPRLLKHLQGRSNALGSGQSSHPTARRSLHDNRISAIPPDPYDRTLNEIPFAHPPYPKARPHSATDHSRHRPLYTGSTPSFKSRPFQSGSTPEFGLDLPEDLLLQEAASFFPQGGAKLPAAFDSAQLPAHFSSPQRLPSSQSPRPRFPAQQKFPYVSSEGWRKPSSPQPMFGLDELGELPPSSSSSMGDLWGNMDELGEQAAGEFPVLDPNFLSKIDLENLPEEDADLGDAVLAEMLGSGVPAKSPMDEAADDVMDDFLTFLDLRASGALDDCLNKHKNKKSNNNNNNNNNSNNDISNNSHHKIADAKSEQPEKKK